MKKLIFFLIIFPVFAVQFPNTSYGQIIHPGHGARTVQEIGQAVFTALQDNRFQNLDNYFPDEVEMRVLRRRSSKDMQLVLDRTSPDSLKQNMQAKFNQITQNATQAAFTWKDWELADAQASNRDAKNPLLYTISLKLANAAGAEETLLFEAVKVRGRYYLFKHLVFEPATQRLQAN